MAILFWRENSKINESIREEERAKIEAREALERVPIIAKSVSIYNIDKNEKIYGKDDLSSRPIASLAKIMTIALAINDKNKGEVISISKEALAQEGDFGLLLDEKWKAQDLAKITLISSANDAAFALTDGYFDLLERINLTSRKIGAQNALFSNFTGLDIVENDDEETTAFAGVEASAEDVNQMASFLLLKSPELAQVTTLPEITLTSESGFTHTFKNTDTIVSKIPNLQFSKTGYTEIAGGNLAIIFKNKKGESIAITILGSTFEDRFLDMEKLVNVLYSM